MQTKKTIKTPVIIRRAVVTRWSGLAEASAMVGRTPTQIKRHIDGTQPSKKLQADMDRLGIVVTKE